MPSWHSASTDRRFKKAKQNGCHEKKRRIVKLRSAKSGLSVIGLFPVGGCSCLTSRIAKHRLTDCGWNFRARSCLHVRPIRWHIQNAIRDTARIWWVACVCSMMASQPSSRIFLARIPTTGRTYHVPRFKTGRIASPGGAATAYEANKIRKYGDRAREINAQFACVAIRLRPMGAYKKKVGPTSH